MVTEKVLKADTLETENVETELGSVTPALQTRGNEDGRREHRSPEGKSRGE